MSETPFPSSVAWCRWRAFLLLHKAREVAEKMLGQTLVTKQTGPAGKPVNVLYIANKMSLAREMYFALLLDRATAGAVMHAADIIICVYATQRLVAVLLELNRSQRLALSLDVTVTCNVASVLTGHRKSMHSISCSSLG